jgi:hypothetical protein
VKGGRFHFGHESDFFLNLNGVLIFAALSDSDHLTQARKEL